MKKRISALLLIMAMVLSICACAGKGETPATSEAPAVSEAPATSDASSTLTPAAALTPTATPTLVPLDLQPVLAAYEKYLSDYIDANLDFFPTLRYAVGYVNDDDIPELFYADDSYHAAGVHVATYSDGRVVELGEYGEYGSFAYIERKNIIYSFYMGMGQISNRIFEMNGTEARLLADFESCDDPIKITLDGKDITQEEYDKGLDEYHSIGDSSYCYFDDGMIPYEHTLRLAADYMNGQLEAKAKNDSFYTIVYDEMKGMIGDWVLFDADYLGKGDEWTHGTDVINGSFSMDETGVSSFWISAPDDELFFQNYFKPLYYFDGGIYDGCENDDWSVVIVSENYGESYYATLNNPDELELCIFYSSGESEKSVIAHFKRDDSPQPEDGVDLDFTPVSGQIYLSNAVSDDPDLTGLTLEAYEWVTLDTPDLIAKYGLPEDLDGYDSEIMRNTEADRDFFASKTQTSFALLDYESGVKTKVVSYDEFMDSLKERGRIFCSISLRNDDPSAPAISVMKEYCG